MRQVNRHWVLRLARLLSLVFLAALGTSALMYYAPGYFSDGREMDGTHALTARSDLDRLHEQQASFGLVLSSQLSAWRHGDLGQSRQYDVPVSSLLKERTSRSAILLLTGVLTGWLLSLLFATVLSLRRRLWTDALLAIATSVLLALPVGVLATVCVVANVGGPVSVLALVIATRDFKILYRLLQSIWNAPYLLHAQAQGLTRRQILLTHIAVVLRREVASLAMLSFTLALSVLVPLEVVFDIPGLGQLAWAAAMNRDLPVLVAVTGVMALCVGLAGLFLDADRTAEAPQCA